MIMWKDWILCDKIYCDFQYGGHKGQWQFDVSYSYMLLLFH